MIRIHWPRAILLAVLGAILVAAMAVFLPPAVDWQTAYRPAALELVSGRSPFGVDGYFNAPWALLPLIPFALLPENIGRAFTTALGLLAYGYVAKKLGAKPWAVLLLLLSPPVLHSLLNGSIDWMAVSGFIMPPQIGLFFISVKPQVGLAVAVFWLVEAWREGRVKEVVRVFGPFILVLLASFAVFGLWPTRFQREIGLWWNASLWPASIPVGLALLTAAIRKRDVRYSMGASPCLSPYVLLHSWVGALLAVADSFPYLAVSVLGLWVTIALRALGA